MMEQDMRMQLACALARIKGCDPALGLPAGIMIEVDAMLDECMRDRMAKAIGIAFKTYGHEVDDHELHFAAGVALQCLREPTRAMIRAGDPRGRVLSDLEKWRAMIDAARERNSHS
jgi:hypothetical protein